ncbi:PREDICTED: carbohydrate sulfotransferase 15-like [Priapulus caudatus]|uniref:Carbohydrate sulfotransferase 15-like n=1 Tax=Priapulus caudatus TaxID=37621 RepID=A0ABM1EX65_PRICU|nr:PREDICTED: carbohydrate sulfotransferase 15-like [Priapulus caudatus]
MYSVFLRDWLQVFPMKQFLILRTEEYATSRIDHLHTVFNFLELGPLTAQQVARIEKAPAANHRRARARSVGAMLPETRRLLTDFYRPYNEDLAALLNDDAFTWQ